VVVLVGVGLEGSGTSEVGEGVLTGGVLVLVGKGVRLGMIGVARGRLQAANTKDSKDKKMIRRIFLVVRFTEFIVHS
jgi:hypothetical protein